MQLRILHLLTIALCCCTIFSRCKKPGEPLTTTNATKSIKANARTFYQPAPSYNSAFQALINQAASGDVIVLQSGSHYVTNPITLQGKNGITILGEDGAVIRKASSAGVVGILIWSDDNTIHHLTIDGGNLPESGIMIYGGHNNITDCVIRNCGNAGVLLHMGAGPACVMNVIEGCDIFYNAHVGVSQSGHCDGRISWNTIYENGYEGITVDNGSHNNDIVGNLIARNNTQCAVGGIGLDGSNGTYIDNNTIVDNKCRSGITFQNNIRGCDGTIVVNNRINGNEGYGILERWTQYRNTNSLFSNNNLDNNRLGTHHIIY